MTKEYQEATNEYLRVGTICKRSTKVCLQYPANVISPQSQNVEPISGLSSEGYKGKGQVQSAPKKKE